MAVYIIAGTPGRRWPRSCWSPASAPPSRRPTPPSCSTPLPQSCSAASACSAAGAASSVPCMGALLLTALINGLTLVGVSEFYQPLSVGIVVVLAALLIEVPEMTTTISRPAARNQSSTNGPAHRQGVSLSFGAVKALREVDLTLRRGEITALVGDNGAGKSTLVRCMSGIHRPDGGQITFDGRRGRLPRPRRRPRGRHRDRAPEPRARRRPHRLAEPVPQPREDGRFVPVPAARPPRHETRSRPDGRRLWPSTCPQSRRGSAGCPAASARPYPSVAQPVSARKLVIMDEPTAALGVQETAKVEELIRKLRDDGHAVLLISHNFEQVLRLRPGLGHAGRTLRRRAPHRRDRRARRSSA